MFSTTLKLQDPESRIKTAQTLPVCTQILCKWEQEKYTISKSGTKIYIEKKSDFYYYYYKNLL